MNLKQIRELTSHISFQLFGQDLKLSVLEDKKYFSLMLSSTIGQGRRIYLQVFYYAPCRKDGKIKQFRGGKHYLSPHMTEDEIVKRAYVAFEATVKHEIMEEFRFDGKTVFNPHVNFRKLLEISDEEVFRTPENFDI